MNYRYFLLLLLLVSGSCKRFLDTVPLDSMAPENYYQTEAQLKAGLAGVYDCLGSIQTYGDQMVRMGMDADEDYYARNNIFSGVAVYNVAASDPAVANNWKTWYKGISRANFLLENIKRPSMDEKERSAIEGEALFLRAYYHFMLVSNWGDVPLVLKTIKLASETALPRTPAKEVYEQIISDMIKSESLVKTIKQTGSGGRVNKSAVRGILARVCLYMAGNPVNDQSKYIEAKNWAKKVMDPDPEDGFTHSLNPSYADVFIRMCQDKYDINESIWEVEFYGNNSLGLSEGGKGFGNLNGIAYLDSDPFYGYTYGFTRITARLWHLYPDPGTLLSSDERREWAIAPYRISGNPAIETPNTVTQLYERNPGKWRRELELVYPRHNEVGPINAPLLRYSDVLLMFAEADNMASGGKPSDDAVAAVNQVRRRAFGKDLSAESVRMVNVTNGGTGYTSAPNVTITGGGGTGATGRAFISAGRVIRIKMISEGTNYTSLPTVTFSGGGGSGAVALPMLSKRQTSQYELTPAQTASQGSFQEVIRDERSRELCFELLRKRDLVRWGKFMENMERIKNDFENGDGIVPKASAASLYGALSFRSATERDVLWPIAPSEMALNSELKPQNSGW